MGSSRGFPAVEAMESRQFFSVSAVPVTQGVKIVAFEDVAYHGKVGSFKASLATLDNVAIRISVDWGDGKVSDTGRILPNNKGGYDVFGDHTYAENGNYNIEAIVSGGPQVTPGKPNPFFFILLGDIHSTAQVKDLKPINLVAPHWIADLSYEISVTPDGVLSFSAPTIRTRKVQLTESQEDALRSAFAGWGNLKRKYPNPPGTADANSVTIGYGGKLVTVGDAAMGVPAAFRTVQSLLRHDAGLI